MASTVFSAPAETAMPTPTSEPRGPVVEQSILDRDGVPAALYDRYWTVDRTWQTAAQAGQIGTTARIVLPPEEQIFGADDGRVASYVADPETSSPIVGPDGMAIIVRDIRTGAVLRTINAKIRVAYGLMTGALLFWMGKTLPNEASDSIDGGVWVLDLADPESMPVAIIPPTDLDVPYGEAVRGAPRLTDRGRAIVTPIQGRTGRATDIIDVESLTVRQRVEDWFALEVVDGLALVIPVHGDPERSQRIRLLDLTTGDALPRSVRTKAVWWSVAGKSEVYVQHVGDEADYLSIIAIALDSGEARVVVAPVRLDLSHELSVADHLVLLDDDWEVTPAGGIHQSVTLLDPVTGRFDHDAFVIEYP